MSVCVSVGLCGALWGLYGALWGWGDYGVEVDYGVSMGQRVSVGQGVAMGQGQLSCRMVFL